VRVLAGDIGGTKTRLGLFEVSDGDVRGLAEHTFKSGDFDGLEAIGVEFLEGHETCARACFGIAGPVDDGRVTTTNLPWVVEAVRLREQLGLEEVILLNDLEATAHGALALRGEQLAMINEGVTGAAGNLALIAAGTGLGEAGMLWDGERHRVFASEGGHIAFAPEGALEVAMLRSLSKRFGRVSWERVLSGQGLVNIFEFLVEHRKVEVPAWLRDEMREGDAAAAISKAALAGRSEICDEALRRMVTLYARKAGDLALTLMARGGVLLGGGIAPKILPRLTPETFIPPFVGKGRMRSLLEAVPVNVILDDGAALLGAARCAAGLY
jgi:glucokinase